MAAFAMLTNNVPIDKVPLVIKDSVAELLGLSISDNPSKQTISRMATELSIISDIHMGEIMAKNEHLTLSWDGCPIADDHINAVQVTAYIDGTIKPYVLQIDRLPGGMLCRSVCLIPDLLKLAE